jgi:hypothetical protein
VCVGEEGGEYEQLTDRGPNAAAGDNHELSKKKVNLLRHTRMRLPLFCPYSTTLGLLFDQLPCKDPDPSAPTPMAGQRGRDERLGV